MMLVTRLALPAAALLFFVLAVVVPALRVRQRTGVWPIVVGRSAAPYQRALAWLMRAFGVAVAAWLVAAAVAGPAAVGVVALPPVVSAAGWALVAGSLAVL